MKVERSDLWLTIGLTATFVVLSAAMIHGAIIPALRIVGTVVGLYLHAVAVVRRGTASVALSLGKVELILLVSQLLGFAAYLISYRLEKGVTIPGNTRMSWSFFYPELIFICILGACVYLFCFWIARRRVVKELR